MGGYGINSLQPCYLPGTNRVDHHRGPGQSSYHSLLEAAGPWSLVRMVPWHKVARPSGRDMLSMSQGA